MVLVILGLLAAFVAPQVLNYLGYSLVEEQRKIIALLDSLLIAFISLTPLPFWQNREG